MHAIVSGGSRGRVAVFGDCGPVFMGSLAVETTGMLEVPMYDQRPFTNSPAWRMLSRAYIYTQPLHTNTLQDYGKRAPVGAGYQITKRMAGGCVRVCHAYFTPMQA